MNETAERRTGYLKHYVADRGFAAGGLSLMLKCLGAPTGGPFEPVGKPSFVEGTDGEITMTLAIRPAPKDKRRKWS